jgi:pimeloyl-ACP methyl ester carboxylesterase
LEPISNPDRSQAQKQVYCISGLGADQRVFSKLSVPGLRFIYLEWLTPSKGESIGSYAKRMCGQLDAPHVGPAPAGPPVLMGVSFGGMMAIEMAKYIPGAKVILISSVASRKELPAGTKLAAALGLYRLIPARPGAWMRSISNYFLGAEGEEEFRLSNEFIENVDPVYLRWAIKQIIRWKNEWQPPVLYHIHGSKDRTFPLNRVAATHVVKGGGHFMVMNRAEEVNALLGLIRDSL